MDHLVRFLEIFFLVLSSCVLISRYQYMCLGFIPFLGGHVVVPKTEKQNLDVVAIAEQYYKV